MSTNVKPEILRAFNGQVQAASAEINAEDTGEKASAGADGLDGSTTQWACRAVGRHLAGVEKTIAVTVSKEGEAVRGFGNKFEVTDQDLAGKFNGMFT